MSTSSESCRSSAYSEDLRWKMVWQKEILGLTCSAIAKNLCVDESTVGRTLQLFWMTGQVSKRKYPCEKAYRDITKPVQLFILNIVLERPGIYLEEIKKELDDLMSVNVSISAICKFFAQEWVYKTAASPCCNTAGCIFLKFSIDVEPYSSDMFVFVDETGADKRNRLRKYGYSIRGKPAVNHSLLIRRERVSVIACMSTNGILDVKMVKEVSDGDIFYEFIQAHLIPHLLPFDGYNPHSVVVLDNCSIHHCSEVMSSLEDMCVGSLPPTIFPYRGSFFKGLKAISSEANFDTETALLASFNTITNIDCKGWISHPGI